MAEPVVLTAPPREVPLSLQLRVRLGGVLIFVGWMFLAMGLLFSWVFVGNSELMTASAFSGPLRTVPGRVVSSEATNYEVNGDVVFAIGFEFTIGDGKQTGTSWTRGKLPREGDPVTIEFVRTNPSLARIQGMSAAPLPAAVGFVLVLPLAGLALVVVAVWRSGRRVHLLRHGLLTNARLVDSQPTGTKINNQRVYCLTFAFVDEHQRERKVVVRSHRHELTSGEGEQVLLYEPGAEHAIPWLALPGRPTTDRDGMLQPIGLAGLMPVLLPPTIIAVVVSLVAPSL